MVPDAKRRIMVVDDDADIRMIIDAALSDQYEVVQAHDGLNALEKLDKYEPDLIIMDMVMPLMNGMEACERIRHNQKYHSITVMFLSAHDTREEIAKTYEAGGNLFLSKPIDPDRLVRNIDLFFQKTAPPKAAKRFSIMQLKLQERLAGDTGPDAELRAPKRAFAPQGGGTARQKAPQRQQPSRSPAPSTTDRPVRQAKAPAAEVSGGALVPRVLIVEDDRDLATLMGMGLKNDFEVVKAHDGLDGVERIVRYQPDLLVIDVMLPRMNGYQLCQSVRANRALAHIPIIFVTAKGSARDREYARKIGGNAFISKPFEMDELIGLCRKITSAEGFRVCPKSISSAEIRAEERQEQRVAERRASLERRKREE